MQEKENSVSIFGGINVDVAPINQPKGTTRFALNAVNENSEGNKSSKTVENSNAPCYSLPRDTTPIGQVYVGNEESIIFLVDDAGNSLIALVDRECTLTILVDDTAQTEKLNFKVSNQIDATYRLRQGCERTIYWVDPKPRVFVIEKPESFQNDLGEWDISKFNLFKTYKTIPDFTSVEVLEGQGTLLPGNYNFAIQYLDADLNPTEFITSTETVAIYNSNLELPFKEVRGSTSVVQTYQDFGPTTKAIKIRLNNLDLGFPFYRIAIIAANSGTGLVSETKYSSEISTRNDSFTYTGTNFQTLGEENEVIIFNNLIDSAQHIEQLENILILGNTKGKQVDFCKLQKYASLITADMITKDVVLNQNIESNSKHPTAHIDGMGYMPGEIYSFGIVYIFEDNTTSFVYHIPGRNPTVPVTTMFSTGENVYPMSNNNLSEDNEYIDNSTCNNGVYWGVDSENDILQGTKVRHHRFPLRTDHNIPLVVKADSTVISTLFKQITLLAEGTIATPVECIAEGEIGYDVSCVPTEEPVFDVEVFYTEDGTPDSFVSLIDPAEWGGDATTLINFNDTSNNIVGTNIVITSIQEEGVVVSGTWDAGTLTFTSSLSPKGLIYTINIADALNQYTEDLYVGKIFGIRFSNIHLPETLELNGNKVIGYYIVRNERLEEDKTVLDSAVMTSTVKNKNFTAAGLLMPQFEDESLIKRDIYNFINPEFKFNQKKYTNFSKIIQQGKFNKTEAIYSRTKINDVMDGTSYVSGKHKFGERDPDGWSIQIKTRDNLTNCITTNGFSILPDQIKETFYLDALADKIILDSTETGVDIFNLACDNKTGIISLKEELTFPIVNSLPYVYFIRDIANPYSNFRLTSYYKESKNPHYFNSVVESADIFNGDSYITPIKYVNSIFYDNRIKKRKGQTNALNYVIGAILIIAAVALTVFTFGLGTAGSIALATAGISLLVGGASLLIMSGIKQDAWNRAYNQLYKEGLRETIADDYVKFDTDPITNQQRGFAKNPSDDEIQWLGDCIHLWFESAINMNLRHGATDNTPDFLNAPGAKELGTTVLEYNREYFGINSVKTQEIDPTTSLDNHMVKKLLYFDYDRKASRAYVGIALAEVYQINPDYLRRNKQKIYSHLPLEYDCCSDCLEQFPQRWHWSLQSFQEELTDNFRTFLPNNYKDLEGNTGSITDIFRMYNALYIHTEEALWHHPQNFQERITGDIISFLGTGEYFNIPPRKIVDDTSSSAGNTHKWGRLKTKHGILFPCYKEKKWYLFTGEKLIPITDSGVSSEFRENMQFAMANKYYSDTKKEYPYLNNPVNNSGLGFISAYDSVTERLIVTKKDFQYDTPSFENVDICDEGEGLIVFENLPQIIIDQEALGFTFIGIENCKLKFIKTSYTSVVTEGQTTTTIANDTDIYAVYDTSGSFLTPQLAEIELAVQAWFDDMVAMGFAGTLTHINDGTERWLNFPTLIPSGGNVLLLSFVNEASPVYHGVGIENPLDAPTSTYVDDYNNFINVIYPTFDNFVGINYPIVTDNIVNSTAIVFLQHSLAAIKGRDYTLAEVNALIPNSAYTPVQWSTIKTSLQTNPYSTLVDGVGDPGLEKYNWYVKSNRNDLGTVATTECEASMDIISPCQFQVDMEEILADQIQIVSTEVISYIPIPEVLLIEGTTLGLPKIESGVTMSYSLEDKQWISWHSYLPSFYISLENRWYGWKQEGNSIYKFNTPNNFRTYFNTLCPFIVEYVDNDNPLQTKIYDGVMFQTQAQIFEDIEKYYRDVPNITFNKIVAYNSNQTTGELSILVKDNESINYINNQISNTLGVITADRNERNWNINALRNLRINNGPMFNKNITALQSNYFIDKIVNSAGLDYNKDWTQQESLRDKFLVIRLIFDTFDNVKLNIDFSVQDKKTSER